MAKPKVSYEESRKQRMEENRKRMEALNLPQLAQALRTSPKPSPMKKTQKPRNVEKQIVEVRRSVRVASQPTPVYREVEVKIPRSYGVSKRRDLSNRVYANEHDRAEATEKAEKFESSLGSDYPTFVKPMLPSHVTGGFWLGLPHPFCKRHLERNVDVALVDEEGEEYWTKYLVHKSGLSGGWRGFAIAHELVDGDALVFQLIKPLTFKVYIIRVESS